jgi:hypothetical protein
MQKYWLATLLIGSLTNAIPVQAQNFMPSGFYIPIPIVGADQNIGSNPNYSRDLDAAKQTTEADHAASPSANLKALSFRVSLTDRQQNTTRFIDGLRLTDAASAKSWEQIFATNDVFGQIDQAMTKLGLNSTNLADAYAVYWTNAWLGAQGRTDDLPQAQLIAVRNQVAQTLLATPEVQAATDAQKQEIAEGLLIQAALIDASVKQAQGNPTLMPQVQTAIKQGAQTMGLALDRLTLTAQGFALSQ